MKEWEWLGINPKICDNCNKKIVAVFYDAKTIHGPWAFLCPNCFDSIGLGLGLGRGQKYVKDGTRFINLEQS
jgi:hypothetical protein